MHPLLTRNRFGLYLLAWIPLAAILIFLTTSGGTLSWLESAAIVTPFAPYMHSFASPHGTRPKARRFGVKRLFGSR